MCHFYTEHLITDVGFWWILFSPDWGNWHCVLWCLFRQSGCESGDNDSREKGCSQLIMNIKCSRAKQTQEGSIERLLGLGVFVEYVSLPRLIASLSSLADKDMGAQFAMMSQLAVTESGWRPRLLPARVHTLCLLSYTASQCGVVVGAGDTKRNSIHTNCFNLCSVQKDQFKIS